MKKNVVIAVVILLIALLGGYLLMKSKDVQKAPSSTNTATASNTPKSLRDLISSGVAQKCSFSTATNFTSTDGVTYIASGKVRGDFSVTTSAKVTKSHIIFDGKTSYIWTDGETTGFKAVIPEVQPSVSPTGTNNPSATPASTLDQKSDYKCEAWIADQSMFALPSGVTFRDMSALIPTAAPGGSNPSQCSYCNNLSGDPKVQCLSALNCK